MPRIVSLSMILAIVGVAFGLWPAMAQNAGNQLHLLQISPIGSQNGNTLTLDSRGAEAALLAGFAPADLDLALSPLGGGAAALLAQQSPALQRGEGNVATINIGGDGSSALLVQQGQSGGFGMGNTAHIAVNGTDSLGVIEQSGNYNFGSVQVNAPQATGVLVQRGNSNNYTLVVEPGTTSSVVVQQIGDFQTGSAPLSISSNSGGTILITQSQF